MSAARTGGPAAPRVGDALGEMLRDALAEQTGRGARPTLAARDPVAVTEVVERDDGFVSTLPASRYLAPPGEWPAIDHRALERARGRVLDVGAGGARASLALQARGYAVTALDVSPGAVEVARARGVRDAVCAPVTWYATTGRRYDTFLLLGNNLGLLGGPAGAPALLGALAALAAPGARVVANGTDPYATRDPVHLAYQERNRRAGRLGGQLRLRVRYRDLASEWFDYLQCTVDELAGLLTGTAWRIDGVDEADAPRYLAVLALRGARVTPAAGRDPR